MIWIVKGSEDLVVERALSDAKGTYDDRVFEPFGLMDRDDRDGGCIGFEPQLAGIFAKRTARR